MIRRLLILEEAKLKKGQQPNQEGFFKVRFQLNFKRHDRNRNQFVRSAISEEDPHAALFQLPEHDELHRKYQQDGESSLNS